jgi:hypothetical protein
MYSDRQCSQFDAGNSENRGLFEKAPLHGYYHHPLVDNKSQKKQTVRDFCLIATDNFDVTVL